jgi:hypothetical protein
MTARPWVIACTLLLAGPRLMRAQADAVRIIRLDDALSPATYAYVRADGGVVDRVDDRGIVFSDRDPALVWACMSSALVVVYRFDTELLRENNTVQVWYRFDEQPTSPMQSWTMLKGMTQAQLEVAAALLAGADSTDVAANPLAQAMRRAAVAAQMPRDLTESFLAAARSARQVTLRVTDPMDHETHRDTFLLTGFARALDVLTGECRR